MKIYTIGIARRYLPGFRKYYVIGHRTEVAIGTTPIPPRLVLRLIDQSELIISQIDKRDWVVYSDYYSVDEEPEDEPIPLKEEETIWPTTEVKKDGEGLT